MKELLAVSFCLLISGASFAQKSTANPKKSNPNKSAIGGVVQDMRRQPVSGIKAFVYQKDSIAASGYTDSTGNFETNFTLPGTYNLKLVYPSEKTLVITAIPVKPRKITMLNIKLALPESDTTISYAAIQPQTPKGASSK